MPKAAVSTASDLSPDARLSYQALRRNARLLGALSASLSREAQDAAEAYFQALAATTPGAWADFVHVADALKRHVDSIEPIVDLNAPEREAHAFFEQIVSENRDLLGSQVVAPA
jgi:hypothetical protein